MMIFKNIPIGTYLPGNSLLHRLQARAKLLLFLCFIICRFVANHHQWHFAPYIAILLLLCSGILLSGFTFFLVLYTLALLLTMTTTPVALIEGMTLLLAPLRWLRLPVDDFALMTLLALRFIPTLIEEIEQLVKAQASRGADFSRGTIRERLQSISALFIFFMQGTLRGATELATALEARGYQGE